MSLSCMVGVRLYATKYLPGRESKGGTSHICYSTSQVSATARHACYYALTLALSAQARSCSGESPGRVTRHVRTGGYQIKHI
eukprot:362367-Rhodomonas_salina.2